MQRTRLFIENREIDLDNSVSFNITKQWEDLTNPTTIINDWSKTIEIPFTKNNNLIFGHIYNVDMKTIEGDYTLMGLYFNPLKKLDFRLEYNGSVIMTGYAKMNTVNKKDGNGRYNITLNGSLGKILQEMQKLTFDNSKNNSEHYYINGEKYFSSIIDATSVSTLISSIQTGITLMTTDEQGYNASDIIGFTPSNALSDNFDSTQYVDNAGRFNKLVNVINSNDFETKTGINANSLLNNGEMKPFDVGDLRCWRQLPFIYFNKLFQIFIKELKEKTGYDSVLDDKWFNSKNVYWTWLVLMLSTLEDNKDSFESITDDFLEWEDNNITTYKYKRVVHLGTVKDILKYKNNIIKISFTTNEKIPNNAIVDLSDNSKLIVNFSESHGIYGRVEQEFLANYRTGYTPSGSIIASNGYKYNNGTYSYEYTVSPDFEIYNVPGQTPSSLEIGLSASLTRTDKKYFAWYDSDGIEHPFKILNMKVSLGDYSYNKKVKSGVYIKLNDLWDNSYSLYDIIMNYCKSFRILINVDDINKKIYFTHATNFFKNYTVENWENKIDLSKEYIITPTLLTNKKFLFNYGNSKEDYYSKQYKSLTNKLYGEQLINTNYNFNNNTVNIFDKPINTATVFAPTVLSLNNLQGYNTVASQPVIVYSVPTLELVCDFDESYKHISKFGSFLINNGLRMFDDDFTTLNLCKLYVTNDSYMDSLDKFCYFKGDDKIQITQFNSLSNIYSGSLIASALDYTTNYGELAEVYSPYIKFNNQQGIYKLFWDNYFKELYGSNNKIITCYIKLSPIDYLNFNFNKFIKIGNQLYFVNKIYDYTITDNGNTKVDLITVSDVTNYTSDNLIIEKIYFNENNIQLNVNDSVDISFYGTGNYTITNKNELDAAGITLSKYSGTLTSLSDIITVTASQNATLGNINIQFKTSGEYYNVYNDSLSLTIIE